MSSPTIAFEDLPTAQRAALEYLWADGPSTVQAVHVGLDPAGKSPYTTMLTALQRLEAAGWVTHAAVPGQGRGRGSYVYTPVCTREEAKDRIASRVVERFFDGDPLSLAQRLVQQDSGLSDSDLAELEKLIEQRRQADRARDAGKSDTPK